MVTLSHRELDRLTVVRAVVEKKLKQRQAAEQLGLSTRQLKRLVKRYRREGAAGLGSRRRGRPSNNRIAEAVRTQAVSLIEERYRDFGPTLACEKLAQRHELQVSVETVRQWMIGAGLWRAKSRAERRAFPRRARRARIGEMVQIDGSNRVLFLHRNQPLQTLLLPPQPRPAKKKSPDRRTLKPRPTVKPPPHHPWRRYAEQPHHSPRPKGTSVLGTKGDISTLR